MKLFLKILFFLLAIFSINISEAKVFVFDDVVSEIKFTVDKVESKNHSKLILKNDFGITCKSESNLVAYRNLLLGFKATAAKGGASNLPTQIHHFATNKHSVFTKQMAGVADEFGLSLNGAWNKQALPHLGRHPNEYHKFVLQGMQNAQLGAKGSQAEFLNLFNQYVKQPVIQNPGLLRKSGW